MCFSFGIFWQVLYNICFLSANINGINVNPLAIIWQKGKSEPWGQNCVAWLLFRLDIARLTICPIHQAHWHYGKTIPPSCHVTNTLVEPHGPPLLSAVDGSNTLILYKYPIPEVQVFRSTPFYCTAL